MIEACENDKVNEWPNMYHIFSHGTMTYLSTSSGHPSVETALSTIVFVLMVHRRLLKMHPHTIVAIVLLWEFPIPLTLLPMVCVAPLAKNTFRWSRRPESC